MTLRESSKLLSTPLSQDTIERNNLDYIQRRRNKKLVITLAMEIASYSQQDFPVSPSQMPDENEERMMTAISGRRLSQSLKQSDRIGLFLKTLLGSSVWYSPIMKLKWQAKPLYSVMRIKKLQTTTQSSEGLNQILSKQGTKQFGLLYQLAPSLRHTGEKEFGLLPTLLKTPTTTETEGGVMEIRENVSSH